MTLQQVFSDISSVIWGWPMIVLLLGTHIFLTIRLKFPQRRLLTAIKLSFSKDKDSQGDVSQFGALATALAATIGTGNIVGVATAVALGGPGAVFWCWITGFFGIATKYGEGVLAVKYRIKTKEGKTLGGPMYALERGLGWKKMGILFAVFTAIAAFGIGNTVQANAISTIAKDSYSISPYITGIVLCILTAITILGGIKSISKVCIALVPFMSVFYMLGCIVILCINHSYLWDAICLILHDAFSLRSAGGGLAGGTLMMAARFGIARGLFSNESGMGSAPIVAAAAQTRNPVRQALVSASGTFWDTVVICAMTGLVITSSLIAYPDITLSDGGTLTKMAFGKIPVIGTPLLSFGLLTFAFSTILGWELYGERAMEYLRGGRALVVYRIIFIAAIFVGSIMGLDAVWDIADCMNALMAIPNLLSLLFLSAVIAKETQKYLWDNHLDMPMDEEEATSP